MEITIEVVYNGETYGQRFPDIQSKLDIEGLLEVLKRNFESILEEGKNISQVKDE